MSSPATIEANDIGDLPSLTVSRSPSHSEKVKKESRLKKFFNRSKTNEKSRLKTIVVVGATMSETESTAHGSTEGKSFDGDLSLVLETTPAEEATETKESVVLEESAPVLKETSVEGTLAIEKAFTVKESFATDKFVLNDKSVKEEMPRKIDKSYKAGQKESIEFDDATTNASLYEDTRLYCGAGDTTFVLSLKQRNYDDFSMKEENSLYTTDESTVSGETFRTDDLLFRIDALPLMCAELSSTNKKEKKAWRKALSDLFLY